MPMQEKNKMAVTQAATLGVLREVLIKTMTRMLDEIISYHCEEIVVGEASLDCVEVCATTDGRKDREDGPRWDPGRRFNHFVALRSCHHATLLELSQRFRCLARESAQSSCPLPHPTSRKLTVMRSVIILRVSFMHSCQCALDHALLCCAAGETL